MCFLVSIIKERCLYSWKTFMVLLKTVKSTKFYPSEASTFTAYFINEDKEALLLSKAKCSFLIVAILLCFQLLFCCVFNCFFLTGSTTVKSHSYQGKNMSCLGTVESHLEHNALLMQLSCYSTKFKSIS